MFGQNDEETQPLSCKKEGRGKKKRLWRRVGGGNFIVEHRKERKAGILLAEKIDSVVIEDEGVAGRWG